MNDLPATSSPTPPPPPGPPAEPFRLLRARNSRLGGVAAGLAAAGGVDVTVARFAVALGALTGVGLLAYIVAWAVIPKEDPAAGLVLRRAPEGTARAIRTGLIVLAAVGGLRFLGGLLEIALLPITLVTGIFGDSVHFDVGGGDGPGWRATIGLVLVAVGVVALLRRRSSSGWTAGSSGPGGAGPGGPGGSAPGSGGSWSPPPPPPSGTPFTGPGGGADAPEAPASRWEKRLLAARALGWLGVLWFLGGLAVWTVLWLSGGIDVRLPALAVIASLGALGLAGVNLVRNRRPAMVLLATAALIVPAVLGGLLTRWEGEMGSRTVRPETAADLQDRYRHLAGELHLDLSRIALEPESRKTVEARLAVGHLLVTVPYDARVTVSGRMGAGAVNLFGTENRGTGVRAARTSAGEPGGAVLDLNLRAGVGFIEVVRRIPFTKRALDAGSYVAMTCRPEGGGISCQAPDRFPTPELECAVPSDFGSSPCRPVGSQLDFDPNLTEAEGTRICRVPANGGAAICGEPAPAPPAPPTPPAEPPAPEATMLCSIPPGGGLAECRPASADESTPTTATAPAAYLCTMREDGTPAECRPAP